MKRKEKKINCIVKSSDAVKMCLVKRLKDLGLTNEAIIKDAATLGRRIGAAQLSRYLTSTARQPPNGLTQEAILWLCTRYRVPVTIAIGAMNKIDLPDGTKAFKLIMPDFDDEEGRKKIVEKFGGK